MKEIQIYGSGGHSYAVIELIRSLNEYTPVRVIDDSPKIDAILDVPVCKFSESFINQSTVISIGSNKARKKISKKIKGNFPTFTHKSAVVYPSARIGVGCVVFPNSVVDADVSIGDFCIINNNATVSHNARIGDFVHIAIQASVAGGVQIGEGTIVGAGSVILPEIKIGKWATIGAGAIVTKDVPDNAMVYGNPAKIIRN
ncbi:acetyltransferase [Patiriisocius marinus]|uniref:Acetyltransferase n=1 Tax=Patiriisocius marinus TaxID=1397112 RepID=A0A5J4IQV0_9FLAO|nr:acetyltransferase [Patiriisocius marinus]GER60159.1 acetyltransferase [Patiriisocius marinus]